MENQVKVIKKLEWLEDEPEKKITKGVPINYSSSTSFREKFLRKSADNILVPVGMLATVACLTMGLVEFKRGNSALQQIYMRGRVGLQAFSMAAMILGTLYSVRNK